MRMSRRLALYASGKKRLSFVSEITAPDYSISTGTGASFNSNFAMIGGGYYEIKVRGYNTSLTLVSASDLTTSNYRRDLMTAGVGDYGLYLGGASYGMSTYSNYADAYNLSMTKTTATNLTTSCKYGSGVRTPNYALVAHGRNSNGQLGTLNSYNPSLTQGSLANLSVARDILSSENIGGVTIFAGGRNSSAAVVGTTDVYTDATLTRQTGPTLAYPRILMAHACTNKYAIFAGGKLSGDVQTNVVEAINASLTRTTIASLSAHTFSDLGDASTPAVGVNGLAVFVCLGGAMDVYDDSLTKKTPFTVLFPSDTAVPLMCKVSKYALAIEKYGSNKAAAYKIS